MDLKDRLRGIHDRALKLIGEAASKSDTSMIPHYSEVIQEAEGLLHRIERIQSEVNELARRIEAPVPTAQPRHEKKEFTPKILKDTVTPKMKGEIRRTEFLQHLGSLGIRLSQTGGSQFMTPAGNLVGIAYASERVPYHWFLGLPIKDYDSIVFLCENEKEEVASFVLPKKVCKAHRQQFSVARNRNYVFNIYLRGANYRLNLPRVGSLNLDEFHDECSPLSD